MGIAIMTPITFWFAPSDGFAMLMGLWNAAIFAGGISAILVNTPGTPASICQAFDGYNLYRQARADWPWHQRDLFLHRWYFLHLLPDPVLHPHRPVHHFLQRPGVLHAGPDSACP